jgi:hypothetical protein
MKELMRRKLLEDLYDRMTDEEKRTFVMLTMQDKSHEEIMKAIGGQRAQIERMAKKVERQNWYTDFGSDVAANFFTDGIIWLVRKLVR